MTKNKNNKNLQNNKNSQMYSSLPTNSSSQMYSSLPITNSKLNIISSGLGIGLEFLCCLLTCGPCFCCCILCLILGRISKK